MMILILLLKKKWTILIKNSLLKFVHDYTDPIYPTLPLRQDMTQGQFLKRSLTGLNSEFSFS